MRSDRIKDVGMSLTTLGSPRASVGVVMEVCVQVHTAAGFLTHLTFKAFFILARKGYKGKRV